MRNDQAHSIYLRHSKYYRQFARSHAQDFFLIDREYPQIQAACEWLGEYLDFELAPYLVALIQALHPYLKRNARYKELIVLASKVIEALELLAENPGWVFMLLYEGHYALGNWDSALDAAIQAVHLTANGDKTLHAQALLRLGTFQLNRGIYDKALTILNESEALFRQVQDVLGIADVIAEKAAFHLNRNDYDRALQSYLDVDHLRREAHANDNAINHSLLMLGVVYRRKRDFMRANVYLSQLLERGQRNNDNGATGTAMHHLAWVEIDQGQFTRAWQLGNEALSQYEILQDSRGISDAHEQLGVIACRSGNFGKAKYHLIISRHLRKLLKNQHGTASVLRQLAQVYVKEGHLLEGLAYYLNSAILYATLGMLTYPRAKNMLAELFSTSNR